MMDQTHKDDAERRLGRVLVYIISYGREAQTEESAQSDALVALQLPDVLIPPGDRRVATEDDES